MIRALIPILMSVWQGIPYTVPTLNEHGDSLRSSPAEVRMVGVDEFSVRFEKTLYAAPDVGSGRPTPNRPGQLDTVWASISEDGRLRRYELLIRMANSEWSDPSNSVFYAAGVRDTGYSLNTGQLPRSPLAMRAKPAYQRPSVFFVGWSMWPGDSTFKLAEPWRSRIGGSTPLLSDEQVQRAMRPELLRTYGYWALRGVCLDSLDREVPCQQPSSP